MTWKIDIVKDLDAVSRCQSFKTWLLTFILSVFIKSTWIFTIVIVKALIIYMPLKWYIFEADFLKITNRMLELSLETLVS